MMDCPTFMLGLLSGDWLFYRDEEIVWDGKHHSTVGIQVNGAKVDQFMSFVEEFESDFDDIADVARHFQAFMAHIEQDEGLIVPRAMIAPGVCKALREGDLTGITLANLAACGSAFTVELKSPDHYLVAFDGRLNRGIPCFFELIARLLWDFRSGTKSLGGKPFTVAFAQALTPSADWYLGDVGELVEGGRYDSVFGMEVDSIPEIRLPLSVGKIGAVSGGAGEEDGVDEEGEGLVGEFADFLDQKHPELSGLFNWLVDKVESADDDSPGDASGLPVTGLTFGEGKRACGRRFSVAVPDGWSVVENYEEDLFFTKVNRLFVAVPGEVGDSFSLMGYSNKIKYSSIADEKELEEFPAIEYWEPLSWWMVTFASFYDEDNESNFAVWDAYVEAVDTACLVKQTEGSSDDGVRFFVFPYDVGYTDSLMVEFALNDDFDIAKAREAVLALARSIEMKEKPVPACRQVFDRALRGEVPADELASKAETFGSMVANAARLFFTAALNRYMAQAERPNIDDCLSSVVSLFSDLQQRTVPYFERFLDLYDVLAKKGASEEELRHMAVSFEVLYEGVLSPKGIFSGSGEELDAKLKAAAEKLVVTERMQAAIERFERIERVLAPDAAVPAVREGFEFPHYEELYKQVNKAKFSEKA